MQISALGRLLGLGIMATSSLAQADPLDGASLYADVVRYETFRPHRFASPGAELAFDWIAEELRKTGFAVSTQPFTLHRQYSLQAR
jgi:hypothetical protein